MLDRLRQRLKGSQQVNTNGEVLTGQNTNGEVIIGQNTNGEAFTGQTVTEENPEDDINYKPMGDDLNGNFKIYLKDLERITEAYDFNKIFKKSRETLYSFESIQNKWFEEIGKEMGITSLDELKKADSILITTKQNAINLAKLNTLRRHSNVGYEECIYLAWKQLYVKLLKQFLIDKEPDKELQEGKNQEKNEKKFLEGIAPITGSRAMIEKLEKEISAGNEKFNNPRYQEVRKKFEESKELSAYEIPVDLTNQETIEELHQAEKLLIEAEDIVELKKGTFAEQKANRAQLRATIRLAPLKAGIEAGDPYSEEFIQAVNKEYARLNEIHQLDITNNMKLNDPAELLAHIKMGLLEKALGKQEEAMVNGNSSGDIHRVMEESNKER
jgi:hypothetical protein